MSVAGAILAELSDDELQDFAARLAPYLSAPPPVVKADGWLDSTRAAEYAGCSKVAIQKAALAGELESAQDAGPNGKRWFTRVMIDAWREGR